MKKILFTITMLISILTYSGTPIINIWDVNHNFSIANGCLDPITNIFNVQRGQVLDLGVKFNNNGNATVPTAGIFFYDHTGNITNLYTANYYQLQALPTINEGCSPDWLSTISITIPINAPYGLSRFITNGNTVYVNVVESVNIKEIENETAIESIKYFDILGSEVEEPILGVIYISKMTYIDGTIKTSKVIIN
jgi:hypothetical protein